MTATPEPLATRITIARSETGTGLSIFASFALFTLFAGPFWRNLISWPGYFILVGVLLIICVILTFRIKPRVRVRELPLSLGAFLVVLILSLLWSAYPGVTAIGVVAQLATTFGGIFFAVTLSWSGLITALSNAFRWILGLSLVFELVVALIIRHPVLPLTPAEAYPHGKLPAAFYWSRGLILHGGQIQGILGNSNLLAMIALLGLIVFALQYADRRLPRVASLIWLAIATLTLGLTRSSTVIIAAVFTAVVLGFALWARRRGAAGRRPVYLTAAGVAVVAAGLLFVAGRFLTHLLGKSSTLTGRTGIWEKVIHLAQERPTLGWGWVSYWAPWVKPYKDLARIHGVTYLQAHNAWLDVWLQVGIVGLVFFILIVLGVFWRSWFQAVDRPRTSFHDDQPYTALGLLPLLLIAALFTQSFAESRILIEGGWALLVILAVKTTQSSS